MIALDTSSCVAYLSGAEGPDVEATAWAIEHQVAALPPAVFSELFSDTGLAREVRDLFTALPVLDFVSFVRVAGLRLFRGFR